MTTTEAAYLIAYPHPSIPPAQRLWRHRLDSLTTGENLRELLRSRYPQHSDDLKRLTLQKPSGLSSDDVEGSSLSRVYDWILKNQGSCVMRHHDSMKIAFPEGPYDVTRDIDILVVTPEIIEAMDFVGDPDGGWRHMRARVEQCEYMRTARSPSESVESPASIKGTLESPCGPRYGRPSDRFGPPTALFSRALALLKKDLDHLDAFMPTPLFAKSAFSFISHAAGLYIDEARRQEFLRESLNDLLQGKGRWQTQLAGGSAKPDGVLMEGLFAYLIIEMKNEPGLGGDPLLQGLVVYSKIVGHEEYAQFLGQSNLPVVLLAIAGNRLVISTAIYTDSIYADEVLSVKLYLGPHASDNVLRVARIFMAINKCTERLRRLYVNLKPDTHSMQPAKVLWPNPTLDSPSPEIPGLEFFSKVDRSLGTPIKQTDINEENKRHAIYLARMCVKGSTLTTDVLVKFAVKYNMVAHRLLAEHEPPLAPVLHSCAPVIGDMYMVVMQYIPDASLLNASLPLPAPNLEAVRRDIKQALDLLHAQDLVFGDLREVNVLYLPEGGGRALLVDFDGVGRHGKDRYSACLNPDVGLGVDGFQVMKKSHDIQNFEKLMERLSGEF